MADTTPEIAGTVDHPPLINPGRSQRAERANARLDRLHQAIAAEEAKASPRPERIAEWKAEKRKMELKAELEALEEGGE